MDDLKKQLEILIDKAEERKLHYMITGQKSFADITEGNLQAFKLIRSLINTNLKITEN